MSINQYSTDIQYHTLLWQQQQQQQQQHYHMEAAFQNDAVEHLHLHKEPLFEKPLTPSDVGKLNRLVIPKQHAEKYFPLSGPGDSSSSGAEKGVLLCFEDEDGKPWRFRYSYWNSSQSYVLTKGWSRYVKEKQLDAGDVVFFHRHRTEGGRLFIGWRRRGGAAAEGGRPSSSSSSSSLDPYRHLESNGSLRYDNPLQYYQSEYPHAGRTVENLQAQSPGNSKTVRLFGVNLECQPDSDRSEPSTPDGSSSYSSHGPAHHHHFYRQQHYSHPHYMDISFTGDVKQMRNLQG